MGLVHDEWAIQSDFTLNKGFIHTDDETIGESGIQEFLLDKKVSGWDFIDFK